MRILAFSHTGLVTGGAEQCLVEYVDHLRKRGHKCRVVMPHDGPMKRVLSNKKIDSKVIGYGWSVRPHKKVNARKTLSSNGNSLVHIFQEIEKYKPDVIIVNTSVIPWGLYAGKVFDIPTILLVHEVINEKDPSLDVLPSYDDYADILNRNTDIVIYNSNFVKNEFKGDLIKPVSPRGILYPVPPLDKDIIDSLYIKNEIDSVLKIAIFGALAPRKNQIEALKAAKILKDKGLTGFRIDLYGDVAANLPYVSVLREYIRNNSLGEHVKIKGFSTSVYETMNEYNVVLSTSTFEPFGRTVVEGQLFGRVAIANNTGGGPELIRPGETGLVYRLGKPKDLATQIEWVMNNRIEAQDIGLKAKSTQLKRFLTEQRYSPLIEAVEEMSIAIEKNNTVNDLFDPLHSLYQYNLQLSERYAKLHRLISNKATRKVKQGLLNGRRNAKQLVKNIIASRRG